MAAVSATEITARRRPTWHGELDLAFLRHGERTSVERRRVCMPLAMQRPFYPEGESVCHALILHPPGGMVGGDRLEIALDVQENAQALVSTPSAAKWYRGLSPAFQSVTHQVAANARLEWLPQETIVFDGADVEQTVRVELTRDAAWLGWEITRFGRTARGETFKRGCWRASTEVWRDGVPLWIDRQQLDGGSRLLESSYGLNGASVVGTLGWIGKSVSPELVDAARAQWAAVNLEGEIGATRLEEGLLCRYRGPSSAAARVWFTEVWKLLRVHDNRSVACPPRIWST